MTTTPQKPLSASTEQHDQYARLAHNTALACLFLCPAIALLPPRKLDLYTFGLAGIWGLSANHMVSYHSGRSVLQHLRHSAASVQGSELPTEKAREFQKRVREEREELARRGRGGKEERAQAGLASAQEAFTGQFEGGEKERQKGVLEKVWMGGETEGWKERRLKEEQEAIDEGKGYGSLIMDQIWEVWNWGKGKEGADEAEKGERSREG